jgi:hypothetical protein
MYAGKNRKGLRSYSILLAAAVGAMFAWAGSAHAQTYSSQWILQNIGGNQFITTNKATDLEVMFSGPLTDLKIKNNPGLSGAMVTANTAKSWTITGLQVNQGT